MPSPQWRPLVVGGALNGAIKKEAEHASGAYAIREREGHSVVYVGESNRGRLWKTMLRHFQAPESFRRVREGFVTSAPARYEVALRVTSRGDRPRGGVRAADERAMHAQAEWIRTLRPTHNKDDGRAEDVAPAREPAIPDDPWGGLLNPARAWTALGRLTRLTWKGARGKEHRRSWSLASAPDLVFDAEAGTPLLLVYGARDVRAATPAEVKRYTKAHWGEEGRRVVSDGHVAIPPLRRLGPALVVTYTTRKGAEGRGELVDWVHPFGEGARGAWRPPLVLEHACQSARCAAMGRLVLSGGTYRVTSRGIVG